jgi:hypothetical protein
MRRSKPDEVPPTTRRYLISDVSDWGQLRWYVQLRDKLPKIRIYEPYGTDEFDRAVDAAIVDQIGKFGDATDWIRAEKQTREKRAPLPTTPPVPGSLRWYWTLYKQSDRWLGNLAIGEDGLAESTRDARTGLIEPLLVDKWRATVCGTDSQGAARRAEGAHARSSWQSVVGTPPRDRLDDRRGLHRAG